MSIADCLKSIQMFNIKSTYLNLPRLVRLLYKVGKHFADQLMMRRPFDSSAGAGSLITNSGVGVAHADPAHYQRGAAQVAVTHHAERRAN